MTQIKTYYT